MRAETEQPDPHPSDAVTGGLLVEVCFVAEERFALRVGECDAPGAPARWGPVHPVHAPGSLHYAHRAADLSGAERSMRALCAWVLESYEGLLAELIHAPGASIKDGAPVPPSFWGGQTWAAHGDHVHLAI